MKKIEAGMTVQYYGITNEAEVLAVDDGIAFLKYAGGNGHFVAKVADLVEVKDEIKVGDWLRRKKGGGKYRIIHIDPDDGLNFRVVVLVGPNGRASGRAYSVIDNFFERV